MEIDSFNTYKEINFNALRRSELGPRSFDSVFNLIEDLRSLYDQIIDIVTRNKSIPTGIQTSIGNSLQNFISNIVKRIQEYDYQKDEQNQFRIHNDITQRVRQLHNQVFTQQQDNLLLLFAAMRSFDIAAVSTALGQLDKARKDVEELNKQQKGVIDSLRAKAGEQTIQNYAEIFRRQAGRHSSFSITFKPKLRISVGAAYFWIAAALILFYVGLTNIEVLEKWFPLNSENPYLLIGTLVKRIALISLWIYLISFSLRQFSINKHLFTLNKHRENALNSFRLFTETIGKDDPHARSQLMLQVAKAIYEQRSTGYLSHKSGDTKEPSILELTRFIEPRK